jgi:hypothetical protein
MSSTIVALVAGIGFILLGRWIYRNPKTLYVRPVHASPDAPLLRIGGKSFRHPGHLHRFVRSFRGDC